MKDHLSDAEECAIIMLATVMVEHAPEAARVAAAPFIEGEEFASLVDAIARLRVEKCLPALRNGFVHGFATLDNHA